MTAVQYTVTHKQYRAHLHTNSTVHIYTQTVQYTVTHRQYSTHLHTDSTVHIYTQTVQYTFTHRTTQLTNWEQYWPYFIFASYTLAFALQLREKHGKTSVKVAEECQSARWEQNVRIQTYTHHNKIRQSYMAVRGVYTGNWRALLNILMSLTVPYNTEFMYQEM